MARMRRGAGWSSSLYLRVETSYPLLPRAARFNKGLRLKETRLTSGIHNFWLLHYYSKIIETLNCFLRELSSFLNAANLMRLFTKKKKKYISQTGPHHWVTGSPRPCLSH